MGGGTVNDVWGLIPCREMAKFGFFFVARAVRKAVSCASASRDDDDDDDNYDADGDDDDDEDV